MLLEDKVAIVTGSGRGMGKSIAECYAEHGACVAVVARTQEQVNATAQGINERGGRAISVVADISDSGDIRTMVDRTVEKFGRVDILVNNAGYCHPQQKVKDLDDDEWKKTFEVNVWGPYQCTKAVLTGMIERNYGTVINISSTAGKIGITGLSAYCAAKHAIIGFTKTLAIEVGRFGITANVICPGGTDTEMMKEATEKYRNASIELTHIKRLAKPEEIAGMALYLASEQARAVTGQAMGVNGGHIMH